MPSDVLEVTTKFMNNSLKFFIQNEERTLEDISQFDVLVEHEVNRHTFHYMIMNLSIVGFI